MDCSALAARKHELVIARSWGRLANKSNISWIPAPENSPVESWLAAAETEIRACEFADCRAKSVQVFA